MFQEKTINEFKKNGFEPEIPYSKTEMSFNCEEGTIIYKALNRTFLVSDYTFWEAISISLFASILSKIKSSLIYESKSYVVLFVTDETKIFEFNFVNLSPEKETELQNTFKEFKSLYSLEGQYISRPKGINERAAWYRADTLLPERITISYHPSTESLALSRVTVEGDIAIVDLRNGGDAMKVLMSNIIEKISTHLASEFIQFQTEIFPYGFRLDVSNRKEPLILDFEIVVTSDENMRFVVGEYQNDSTTVFSRFIEEEWKGSMITINFNNGDLIFDDDGLLKAIKRRQLTSHFSFY